MFFHCPPDQDYINAVVENRHVLTSGAQQPVVLPSLSPTSPNIPVSPDNGPVFEIPEERTSPSTTVSGNIDARTLSEKEKPSDGLCKEVPSCEASRPYTTDTPSGCSPESQAPVVCTTESQAGIVCITGSPASHSSGSGGTAGSHPGHSSGSGGTAGSHIGHSFGSGGTAGSHPGHSSGSGGTAGSHIGHSSGSGGTIGSLIGHSSDSGGIIGSQASHYSGFGGTIGSQIGHSSDSGGTAGTQIGHSSGSGGTIGSHAGPSSDSGGTAGSLIGHSSGSGGTAGSQASRSFGSGGTIGSQASQFPGLSNTTPIQPDTPRPAASFEPPIPNLSIFSQHSSGSSVDLEKLMTEADFSDLQFHNSAELPEATHQPVRDVPTGSHELQQGSPEESDLIQDVSPEIPGRSTVPRSSVSRSHSEIEDEYQEMRIGMTFFLFLKYMQYNTSTSEHSNIKTSTK